MNKMRRQDRAISNEDAIKILEKGEYGILSMCTTDNEGYGVPLNYVLDDDRIYFHCAVEGMKLNCIKKNNNVSFCVVGNTEVIPSKFGTLYESAIAFGKASEIEGEEKLKALEKIIEKYSKDYVTEGKGYIEKFYDKVKIIKLTIAEMTGKAKKE